MDKNKNRTDLLAAGRKKLQQFRKKKDSKGKSSHKGSKSEQESDADLATSLADVESREDLVAVPPQIVPEQEDTLTIKCEEGQGVSLGPLDTDKSVVVREVVPAAELVAVDSSASRTTISRYNSGDEEKGLLCILSSFKESESQEADGSGSNQHAEGDKEIDGPIEDGKSLEFGYVKLESEGDQESAVSGHGESDQDLTGEFNNIVEPEKLTHEAEEFIEGTGASFISSNDNVVGSHDEASVSISAEPTDEAERTAYTNFEEGKEGANYRTEGTDEMDGVPIYTDDSDNEGLSVSPVERREEVKIGPIEGTCETTFKTEGTDEGAHRTGNGSDVAAKNYESEETLYMGGAESSESQLEGVGVDSFREKEIETLSLSDDLGSDCRAGGREDTEQDNLVDELYEQNISSEEAVPASNRQENLQEADIVLNGTEGIFQGTNTGSDDRKLLAEVIQGLGEEEVRCLLKVSSTASKPESEHMGMPQKGHGDLVECLKQQLYFSIVAKDIFKLQLSEQIELHKDFEQRDIHMLNEVCKLNCILKETQNSNTCLIEELAQCRSDLHSMAVDKEELETQFTDARKELAQCKSDLQVTTSGKAELETQFASARKEVGEITTKSFELQTQLERSHEEMSNVLAELAGIKCSMEALETENRNIHENFTAVIDERNKLEEENKFLVHENERIAAKVLEHQDCISKERDEHAMFEVDLKEAMTQVEKLTQENLFLFSSLDLHKAKLEEIGSQNSRLLSQASESGYQIESLNGPKMHCSPNNDECSTQSSQQVGGNIASDMTGSGTKSVTINHCNLDESVGTLVLKAHFDEAEEMLQKLEKAIEGMHSHSVSLSRLAKVPGVGVSKLIQAFESKVHHDENGPSELPLNEGERLTEDKFTLAKEQASNLRDILKRLDLSALKVDEEYKEEKNKRQVAFVAISELQILYETSKQHSNTLEARIVDLVKKISDYQSKMEEMQIRLDTMNRKSDETEAVILTELENLQKNVVDKLCILEQEWNFTIGEVSEKVEKLNTSIARLHSTSYSSVQSDELIVGCHIAASVSAATKLIEDLHEKLGAAYTGLTKLHNSYESLNEKFSDLHVRNGLAVEILGMIYDELEQFTASSSRMDVKDENLYDLLHPSNFIYLLNQLGELLEERSLLKSARAEVEAELNNKKREVAELEKKCIKSESFFKLVEDVNAVVKLNDIEIDFDKPLVSHLESMVSILVQKYREANEQVILCKEKFDLKMMEYNELQAKVHQLSFLSSQQEEENQILKKNLKEVDGTLEALRSDLQARGAELEQSEQRLSSVREKLSIAVAKGKGLIVQRDTLKQSLSEMSSELERCSQEIQVKDTRLQEVETKLKAYSESEAGERVEALESELSYIRNSTNALRDSFLLKDSVLQRVEEVLEELEMPDHFHSRDTIEKIEWLVSSVSGNSLPFNDWDKKSSVGGESYADASFVVMDGWKEDTHQVSNPWFEDLKRKNEELQSKFYGLAEQNEMLEQSLMERNKLVQRLEEVLDRMNIPLQLRSMDTEERIEWLASALSEAEQDNDFLQKKIENFESHCGSLAADLEQSQRKISDLELALLGVTRDREILSEHLQNMSSDQEKVLEKVTQYELEKCSLQNEIAGLQEKLVQKLGNENHYHHMEDQMMRLQVLVSEALQDQSTGGVAAGGSATECLEGLLRKLIENYMELSFEKSALKDIGKENHAGESDVVHDESRNENVLKSKDQHEVMMKEELDAVLSKLANEKAERERILENYQSLVMDFEVLGTKRDELQEKVNQEEMKLVSTKDKLNIAVRKGKGLVQQRDSLKQTIEEMKVDMDHLKNELYQRESSLVQCQEEIRYLSTFPEKVEILEGERFSLQNRLTEMEHSVQDNGHILKSLLDTLNAIDVGSGLNPLDPIKKMETIGKLFHDLQAALTSSEHESKKSKRATELLLAELNEVNERADGLQEELSKIDVTLSKFSEERNWAYTARTETLSRLENVIIVQSEERKKEHAEAIKIKAVIDQLREGCLGFTTLLDDVFSGNLKLLSNVEDGMESMLRQMDSTDAINLPLLVAPGDVFSGNSADEVKFRSMIEEKFDDYSIVDMFTIIGHGLQECTREVDNLREKCYKHTIFCDVQAKRMSKAMDAVYKEMSSRKNFELMRKEKDTEILMMNRLIALLYEACTNAVLEIEKQTAQVTQDGEHGHGWIGMNSGIRTLIGVQVSVDGQASFTEECVKSIVDTLLLAVRDLINLQAERVKKSQTELKSTISNLQKELQENDIQKSRICTELGSQIKNVESDAHKYMLDLQSANTQVKKLENRVEALEKERSVLELRIKDLQDGETSSMQLQENISSLNDLLSAKGQEIEGLMQALDEEESQMEGLRSKVEELEKILQQKNVAFENLEASRGKAMAKLSNTVSKFDELHQLSESLLSEVENLQLQLQDRDAEISFLRQEVTRCTNEVLVASQESSNRNLMEMHDLLTWLDTLVSRFGGYDDLDLDGKGCSRMEACKETLEKKITSLLAELEDLHVITQNKDALLGAEKNRTEELSLKSDSLARSLREKELKIASLQSSKDLGETTSGTSEITEVEPMINKRAIVGASVTPHVRGVRKVNNDQVAISIDTDPGGSAAFDDEDDKVHGFKSLTTSRIVPKFTRPVSDMIDGLWVSCDRALMRQPALRLGIIIYWFMLHTLLASSMV